MATRNDTLTADETAGLRDPDRVPEKVSAWLRRESCPDQLVWNPPPLRHETGDTLEVTFRTVWPERCGHGRLRIEHFAGGGFAGQVYCCRIEEAACHDELEPPAELRPGRRCAVKILVPPTRGKRRFRDALYTLGFQAPFAPRVNEAACRLGLLLQKLIRCVLAEELGDEGAVADVYASFYDPILRAWGEIREWVEGRSWRLEADPQLLSRRHWRVRRPEETGSPEFVAKRQFMACLVHRLRQMGAAELSRQFEWWTLKSQTNVLKRLGFDDRPAAGLCAVDFRPGLTLLPFLPMSPADIRLIVTGICRGAWAQYDRLDARRFDASVRAWAVRDPQIASLAVAIRECDRAYRRSQPDLIRHAFRFFRDRALRGDVRQGMLRAYAAVGDLEESFVRQIEASIWRVVGVWMLGLLPGVGKVVRRWVGNDKYRAHVLRLWTDRSYLKKAVRARQAAYLAEWVAEDRIRPSRALRLLEHPVRSLLERALLGWWPRSLHHAVAEPSRLWQGLRNWWSFVRRFFRDPAFRELWLTERVREGVARGMVTEQEAARILGHIREPMVTRYLQSLGVHFATLPVTQVVSFLVGGLWALGILLHGGGWETAMAALAGTVVFFQVFPVSPGSVCRGMYVVGLMIHDRKFRQYVVAAPLAFVKYVGYLAFPLQMVATYPELSRFMAGYWATAIARRVPVFGESGGWVEHAVFDLVYNLPLTLGRWLAGRIRAVLNAWLLLGVGILAAYGCAGGQWTSKRGVNLVLGVTTVFILPRVLFYPLMRRGSQP